MNGACALHVGYQRLQTNTQSTQNLLLFHCHNGDTKTPQRYVLSLSCFISKFSGVLCLLVFRPPPYKYYINGGSRKKKEEEEEEEEV